MNTTKTTKHGSPYKSFGFFLSLVILAFLIALLIGGAKPEVISYDTLISKVEAGEVEAIYISSYTARVKYTEAAGSKYTMDEFKKRAKSCDAQLNISYRSTLSEQLYDITASDPTLNVTVYFDDPSSGTIWTYLLLGGGSILVLLLFLFLMNRQNNSANNSAISFGKTKARLNQNVKVKFSDVAGADEEKDELREIVDFLRAPKKYIDAGARIPHGVLLVGPPGTGKTLFAKAVAGEAKVPFFSISGSDFVEMFVGVGASRVRDLFAQAKANTPCIIFIDEIDAVGRQRGAGLGGGHDEREQTLNQLLVQMDGFETNDGVIIMAATNRADILDPALLRPGRFDRQIYVNIPDVRGREAIFKVHARNKTLAGNIDFKILARMTSGFTGADIENLLNEAAILAARDNRKVLVMKDILEGINKVIMGPQKRSRLITESDKRITAYHEAGHAILGHELPNCDDVQEISIIPRGAAAGYTLTRPDNDNMHMSKQELLDEIVMLLGGRAAEELVLKDVCTGASSDIQRATGLAKNMIMEWGMSDVLGNSYWGSSNHEVFLGRDYAAQHSYSEDIAGQIDAEIKSIIDAAYVRAKDILAANRGVMDSMVRLLYERETIFTREIDMLFEGKTAAEIIAILDEEDKKNAAHEPTVQPHVTIDDLIVKEKEAFTAPEQPTDGGAEVPHEDTDSATDAQPNSEDGSED